MKKHDCSKERINVMELWYSEGDLAIVFGKSRQYWGKLMRTGKIYSQKTSAGFITTHTWLLHSGYIKQ